MTQKELERFYVQRTGMDRRSSQSGQAPYLTEEGMVLVDRRENGDRRKDQRGSMNAGPVDLYLVSRLA